jgi:hypothetical protein
VKRPPDRKLVLAALVLLVAASALASKPEAGFAQKEVLMSNANRVP